MLNENRGKYAYSSDALSVSQLYKLVKTYDKVFVSAPKANKMLLNKDGTPKVFYHGTDKPFTEFKLSELRSREGSFFFAESREDAEGYGKYVHEVYLRGEKLADYDNQPREFFQLKDKK